jgi:hypothetical protein
MTKLQKQFRRAIRLEQALYTTHNNDGLRLLAERGDLQSYNELQAQELRNTRK